MAFGTLERWPVLAQQRKFGLLVVIEQEFLPALFVVAGFALRPVFALMRLVVILLVARHASHLKLVFIYVALVAVCTFQRRQVLAQQRKFGLVVIELEFFPAFFIVAGFAFRPEFSLVCLVIFLLVARHASHLHFVLVQVALVASRALHRRQVLAQQREFGLLAMIEQDLFPSPVGMAGFALRPELALVRLGIVLPVTFVTKYRNTFILFIDMTSLALNFYVLSFQLKFRFAVIEMGSFPVLFLVTIRTLFTQAAFVLVSLFMTTEAVGRSLPVFFLREMTVLAENLLF